MNQISIRPFTALLKNKHNYYRSQKQYICMGQSATNRGLTFVELCDIVRPIAKEHGIIRMYLFGSRARGDYDGNSDYDFCIVVPEEYDLFDLGGILYALRDALGSEVDIVCEDDVRKKSYLEEEILRDRRIVFEA